MRRAPVESFHAGLLWRHGAAVMVLLFASFVSADLANGAADTHTAMPAPASATAAKPESSPASSESRLVSHGDLSRLGVHVRRKRLDTPGASLTLEITIDDNGGAGRFVAAECIVLRDVAAMENVAAVDASADLSEKAARRNSSDKTDTTFLVLGREIDRAYLVFEFSSEGKPDQRYLLPVAAVPKRRV